MSGAYGGMGRKCGGGGGGGVQDAKPTRPVTARVKISFDMWVLTLIFKDYSIFQRRAIRCLASIASLRGWETW